MSLVTMGLGSRSAVPFSISSVVGTGDTVVLTASSNFTLTGPAAIYSYYSIPGLTIYGMVVASPVITFSTSAQASIPYTLNIPSVGIIPVSGATLLGPYNIAFDGLAAPVTVSLVSVIDARLLEIVFNRAVNKAQASNVNNYSISPPLAIIKATYITDSVYRLQTSRQVQGQIYTVTISGLEAM